MVIAKFHFLFYHPLCLSDTINNKSSLRIFCEVSFTSISKTGLLAFDSTFQEQIAASVTGHDRLPNRVKGLLDGGIRDPLLWEAFLAEISRSNNLISQSRSRSGSLILVIRVCSYNQRIHNPSDCRYRSRLTGQIFLFLHLNCYIRVASALRFCVRWKEVVWVLLTKKLRHKKERHFHSRPSPKMSPRTVVILQKEFKRLQIPYLFIIFWFEWQHFYDSLSSQSRNVLLLPR